MARLSCLINLNIYRGYKYRKPLESIFMRNLNLFIMKCISIYFVTLLLLMTMPKFTSQILLLFSKVLHILEKLLLKNFTGLKVVS